MRKSVENPCVVACRQKYNCCRCVSRKIVDAQMPELVLRQKPLFKESHAPSNRDREKVEKDSHRDPISRRRKSRKQRL